MSRSGCASRSSSAAVAWPAMTRGSSNGWIIVAPVSTSTAAHKASRAGTFGAQNRIVAPKHGGELGSSVAQLCRS